MHSSGNWERVKQWECHDVTLLENNCCLKFYCLKIDKFTFPRLVLQWNVRRKVTVRFWTIEVFLNEVCHTVPVWNRHMWTFLIGIAHACFCIHEAWLSELAVMMKSLTLIRYVLKRQPWTHEERKVNIWLFIENTLCQLSTSKLSICYPCLVRLNWGTAAVGPSQVVAEIESYQTS